MAAIGSLALLRAERPCKLADIAGAMTLEGLNGIAAAFDERVQQIRPHHGQAICAENLRLLLKGGDTATQTRGNRVQDPYSLRCMPQSTARRDALDYARRVFEIEINSATDNPLVFAKEGDIISGGNFHGQPLALALDFAAIALAEIGNISERRVEQLVNPTSPGFRPSWLKRAASSLHDGSSNGCFSGQ